MTRLKLGFSDRAIPKPIWRALYRQFRIINRECRHAVQDMAIFGTGYIKTGPDVPDFIRRVHPSNVAESLLETAR